MTTSSSLAFVRSEMLPQQVPPPSQRGALKWMRENLFSSVFNSLLTVAGLVVVVWLVAKIFPWAWYGLWHVDSLTACREEMAVRYGEGVQHACWGMITWRWQNFMFGFYPPELLWRPILTGALLIAALPPVLYWGSRRVAVRMVAGAAVLAALALWGVEATSQQTILVLGIMAAVLALGWLRPKALVWLTLLFPFIGFWLLWGGTIWSAVTGLVGFLILGGIMAGLRGAVGPVVSFAIGLVAASLFWLFLQGPLTGVLSGIAPIELTYVGSDKFGGFLLSFVIGVTAISASLPLGVLFALGRRSDMPLIKGLSVGFIEFIRGVPLITLLFTASLLLQYFLPPQTKFDLILRVIILVTFFSAAYIAEVIRGGLAALPRGQYEAGDALGLDYWQAQQLILMPQALKVAIPGIVSTFIGLFKDTTLVALVGLKDPLVGIRQAVLATQTWKGLYWEPFILVGAIFFIINFSMSRYSMYLERKLKRDHR